MKQTRTHSSSDPIDYQCPISFREGLGTSPCVMEADFPITCLSWKRSWTGTEIRDRRGGSRLRRTEFLRYSCVIKLVASVRSWKNIETGSLWIPLMLRLWVQRIRDDSDFPRRPHFGKTLKRLRSNGLEKGERAKGPVTPERKISWREMAKQNDAARWTSLWWRSLEI